MIAQATRRALAALHSRRTTTRRAVAVLLAVETAHGHPICPACGAFLPDQYDQEIHAAACHALRAQVQQVQA